MRALLLLVLEQYHKGDFADTVPYARSHKHVSTHACGSISTSCVSIGILARTVNFNLLKTHTNWQKAGEVKWLAF